MAVATSSLTGEKYRRFMQMQMQKKILVTGAGGFIGHHLVHYLTAKGCWVRGKPLITIDQWAAADRIQMTDHVFYADISP